MSIEKYLTLKDTKPSKFITESNFEKDQISFFLLFTVRGRGDNGTKEYKTGRELFPQALDLYMLGITKNLGIGKFNRRLIFSLSNVRSDSSASCLWVIGGFFSFVLIINFFTCNESVDRFCFSDILKT